MKRWSFWPVLALFLITLAGCSERAKDGDAPVSTTAPTIVATAVVTANSALNPASSQLISDGMCTALIPDAWTDLGHGRGLSPSDARFTLFGNKLAGDSAWTAAAGIVATISASGTGKLDQSADSISFTRDDGSSYEIRRRLADRYCDLSIFAAALPPPDERNLWPAIGASMAAAPAAP